MKTFIISIILSNFFVACYGQRFSLEYLKHIYLLAESNASVSEIDNTIKYNATNWVGPKSSKKNNETTLSWQYVFVNSTRGFFYILNDDDKRMPITLYFQFPYKVQYDDYLSYMSKNFQLVNVLTENGKQTQVYESDKFVITLSVFPPETKTYYIAGLPAPFYEIYLQRKGFRLSH
jgi:hypothetical protein